MSSPPVESMAKALAQETALTLDECRLMVLEGTLALNWAIAKVKDLRRTNAALDLRLAEYIARDQKMAREIADLKFELAECRRTPTQGE